MEKNFDASKKQLAIVERKRAAGVDMQLGKVQIKQRKVVGGGGGSAKESKKSQLASILFSWIKTEWKNRVKLVYYIVYLLLVAKPWLVQKHLIVCRTILSIFSCKVHSKVRITEGGPGLVF